MKKYVDFVLVEKKPKTNVYNVVKRRKRSPLDKPIILHERPPEVLGQIYWYGPWRQYIFEPLEETIWSKGCMQQVQDFLKELMDARKAT